MTPSSESDLLSGARAIALWFGFSEASTRHRIQKGEIPTFRLGGTICARKSTLAAWLAEQEAAAMAERAARPAPAPKPEPVIVTRRRR